MRILSSYALAACLVLSLIPLRAQSGPASLQGQISDPSGSVVPKAVITVSNSQTAVRTVQSDDQGRYRMDGLPPGTYVLRAIAKGFTPFEVSSYELAPGRKQLLNISLSILVGSEKVTVADVAKVDMDPSNNAGALVLQGKDLEALSDDRDDLATDLQALAGPAAGPNGGQIFIDGFTGGRLPSKQSIREVRINQNPFAAQYDRPGQGRVEIFTKPGTEEFHGQFQFQFSDAFLNSRNPFVTVKPPYQRRQSEGEVSGPLGKKTSFFADFEHRAVNENAFVNALTLNQSLDIVPFSQAVVTPLTGVELNFKIDRQLSTNHTLTARYGYNRDSRDNQGVGNFSLPTRGYHVQDNEDTFQLTETGVLNTRTVNEIRFRYRRQRTNQIGADQSPTISVLDAFTSGGSPFALSYNNQDRFELQNLTSVVHGAHVSRWGGLMRGILLTDQATQNYAGTFTFTSLSSYRQTLLGLRNGLTPDQIRISGGGASQFSLSAGNPLAAVNQFDFGFFIQDDWKLLPNLTLSGGLRYERQTHVANGSDFGPRLGFAWGLGGSKPKTVIRGGFGIFYDRLNESLTLDALRQDGIRQQQFLIPFPDFYPAIPSAQSLSGSAQPQAIRKDDAHWRAPVMVQGAIGLERQLPKKITVSSNFIYSRGTHTLRSRNINAPLPGGNIHPYGGANSIYLYETSGVFRQRQWITNVNARVSPKLTFSGFYAWGSARSNTDGAGTFPANQYDLTPEYGRAGFDIRHRVQFNGSVAAPWGLRFSPFLTITSGRPYNITLGRDLNGDSLYTDRPGFATNPAPPYGVFDIAPQPGQTIIPRNYGEGPGFVNMNLRLGKTFTFGEKPDGAGGKKASGDPRELTFSIMSRNLWNHPNLGSPDGNLSSLLFGRSTSLVTGGQGGNRRLDLQVRFSF